MIYITFFVSSDGERMPKDVFTELCRTADWKPEVVLDLAANDGWQYIPSIDSELEIAVAFNNPRLYFERRKESEDHRS